MTSKAYSLWLRLYSARIADWKTNEEQLANVEAIIEADREEAALKERAAIVHWLRNFWDGADDEDLKAAADAIEAGDHSKEPNK
jgi:hypothetical protein